jgi:hypothetical protein
VNSPNTSCAVDATGHGGLDEGSEVLVLDTTLVFHEAAFGVAVDGGDILKIALATLITNWAVKGVVGKKELHHTAIIIILSIKVQRKRASGHPIYTWIG